MLHRLFKEERGSLAVPVVYITVALLSVQLGFFGITRYFLGVLKEDIQSKLDMSNMACYPNLSLESLADTAKVYVEETEAKKTFEFVLCKQLELDPLTKQPLPSSPITRLEITKFEVYTSSEVPVTLSGGRQILHSPAIESQITAHVRLPFLGGTYPLTFRSVTDLPQTP